MGNADRRSLARREFLSGSAALAVAGLASKLGWGSNAAAAISPSPIRLGVASYSFRKFGIPDVIQFMQVLHTPYLNAKDMHLPMTSASEVKRVADEYGAAGITLTAAGVIYFTKDDDEDMRRKFEYCKIAGIPLIVAGPTPETLPRLEKFVKEYDIKIAIHNHGPEDKYFPSPLEGLKAVRDMDPRMGVCVDVGHTARTGTDVPNALRAAGPRLFDVHMKDLTNASGKWVQVAVGDGSLPVAKIFAALVEIQYPGYVDLEYEVHEEDPMPGMIQSFAYMRGVLAGMGYGSG